MADGTSLHIDTDWKKQAQEEKRRLAEEQAKRAAEAAKPPPAAPPAMPPGVAPVGPATGGSPDRTGRGSQRGMPEASLASLIQSQMTQAMFYLGEIAAPGQPPTINLDMARHHLDTLRVIEEKTVNNLTEDEQRLVDHALYDLRSRFVSVASQYL